MSGAVALAVGWEPRGRRAGEAVGARCRRSQRTQWRERPQPSPIDLDTSHLEGPDSLFIPDILFEEPRNAGRLEELAGERELATMILADALVVIARACDDLARRGRLKLIAERHDGYDGERLMEDLVWLFEADGSWRDRAGGVSYERICEVVGIDPDRLRATIETRCRRAYAAGERVANEVEAPKATGEIIELQGRLFAHELERVLHSRDRPGDGDDGLGESRRRRRLRGYRVLGGEEAPYLRDEEG